MAKEIPESVRRWYRRIGAMGGKAGKGKPERRELMRRAINIRWARVKKAKAAEKKELKKIFVRKPGAPEMPAIGFK
jgi:hypothetical protein